MIKASLLSQIYCCGESKCKSTWTCGRGLWRGTDVPAEGSRGPLSKFICDQTTLAASFI
jgi:hypothetical protein